MEGLPRILMISLDLKESSDTPDISNLNKYIESHYHERSSNYKDSFKEFLNLRQASLMGTENLSFLANMKRYFCQLQLLKQRFPLSNVSECSVSWSWEDSHSNTNVTLNDIRLEEASIKYNIGCLHCNLGAAEKRIDLDSTKIACTHFQCAAWAFQSVLEQYTPLPSADLECDVLRYLNLLMLAQAHECVLEKSMVDQRRAVISAKIAFQISDLYKQCQGLLQSENIGYSVNSKQYKLWKRTCVLKEYLYHCLSYYYMALGAEDSHKYGETIAWLKLAQEKLDKCSKPLKELKNAETDDTVRFVHDVVNGKFESAKKDNDFIYYEKVPEPEMLQPIKGALLLKGIGFDVNDTDICGPDIFKNLIPMETHISSSIYSEKKAEILRNIQAEVEAKDNEIDQFLADMHWSKEMFSLEDPKVPQELYNCAAFIAANREELSNIKRIMQDISSISIEVEESLESLSDRMRGANIAKSGTIWKKHEKEYSELLSNFEDAKESNLQLREAFSNTLSDFKLVDQPMDSVIGQFPSVTRLADGEDMKRSLEECQRLLSKVDEMRAQRSDLIGRLRADLQADDATQQLLGCKSEQEQTRVIDDCLRKHDPLIGYLRQNMAAQSNIMDAVVDQNAAIAEVNARITSIRTERDQMIARIALSFNSYKSLLKKGEEGIDFYRKLGTKILSLHNQIDSLIPKAKVAPTPFPAPAIMEATPPPAPLAHAPSPPPLTTVAGTPRLKDYLNDRRKPPSPAPAPVPRPDLPWGQYGPPSAAVHSPHYAMSRPRPADSEYRTTQNMRQPAASSEVGLSAYPGGYSSLPRHGATGFPPSSSSQPPPLPSNSGVSQSFTIPYQQQQFFSPNVISMAHSFGGGRSSVPPPPDQPHQLHSSTQSQYGYYYYGELPPHPANQPATSIYGGQPPPSSQSCYQIAVTTTATTANEHIRYHSDDIGAASSYYYYGQQPNSSISSMPNRSDRQPDNYRGQQQHRSIIPDNGQLSDISQQHQHQYHGNDAVNNTAFASSFYYGQQPNPNVGMAAVTDNMQSWQAQQPQYHGNNADSGIAPAYFYGNQPNQSEMTNNYPVATATDVQSHPQFHSNSNSNTVASSSSSNYYYGQQSNSFLPNRSEINENIAMAPIIDPQSQQQLHSNSVSSNIPSYYYNQPPTSSMQNRSEITENPTMATAIDLQFHNNSVSSNSQSYYYNQQPTSSMSNRSETTENSTMATKVDTQTRPQFHNNGVSSNLPTSLYYNQSSNPSIPSENNLTTTSTDLLSSSPTKDDHMGEESKRAVLAPTVLTRQEIEDQREERRKQVYRKRLSGSQHPLGDNLVLNKFIADAERFMKRVGETLVAGEALEQHWAVLVAKERAQAAKRSSAVGKCCPMKNRLQESVPFDENRVVLKESKDDYVNASHIVLHSIDECLPRFITFQSPLVNTVGEFWTAIFEQGCELIVQLVQACDKDDTSKGRVVCYWPDGKGQFLSVGAKFDISVQSHKEKSGWSERILLVKNLRTNQSRSIWHFQVHNVSNKLPKSHDDFLSFVCELCGYYRQQRSLTKPIGISCMNGASVCGVMVLLTTALTIMEITGQFPDVDGILATMWAQRRGLLDDKHQLAFVYKAVSKAASDMLSKRNIVIGPGRLSSSAHPDPHSASSCSLQSPVPPAPSSVLDFIFSGQHIQLSELSSAISKWTVKTDPAAVAGDNVARNSSMVSPPISEPEDDKIEPKSQTIGSEKTREIELPSSLRHLEDPASIDLTPTPPDRRRITKKEFVEHLTPGYVRPPAAIGGGEGGDPLRALDPLYGGPL